MIVQRCVFDFQSGKTKCFNENKSNGYGSYAFCNLNEYCTAEGKCLDLIQHPRFLHDCQSSDDCEPFSGLSCLHFQCQICYPENQRITGAEMDVICQDGRWRLQVSTNLLPTNSNQLLSWILIICFFISILLFSIFSNYHSI